MDSISTADLAASVRLPGARLGPVRLVVRDVARSAEWYRRALGLHVMSHSGPHATLGDGVSEVLLLDEDPRAAARARTAGIYHFALLFPTRVELARVAVRLATEGIPLEGLSDHRTHEAIYLSDPDQIGIELARDRPRSEWPADWGYGSGPAPLDVESLLGEVGDGGADLAAGVGEGLRMGHVHLTVNDVDAARSFYSDAMGFGITADLGSAVFFAAGEYHHHLATNVWRGSGIPSQPEDVVGLRHWTLELPDAGELDALGSRLRDAGHVMTRGDDGALSGTDPAGIPFRVVVTG